MVAWRGDDRRPSFPLIESPFYDELVDNAGLTPVERAIADAMRRDGYAVINFPEPQLGLWAEAIRHRLAADFDRDAWVAHGQNKRFANLWREMPEVRAIACNQAVLALLSKLYGRRAFANQTLNFLVGTQQKLHSDAAHFNSVPERFMCGVWVALEDTDAYNGPLAYVPGSHRLPCYGNDHVGVEHPANQRPYESFWQALVQANGLQQRHFLAKRGQALIWAANLLHGGAPQTDRTRTRLSQVTHYYFEGCAWYHPVTTDWILGRIGYERAVDIATGREVPQEYCGRPLEAQEMIEGDAGQLLPRGFDPAAYLAANPDVAAAGADAAQHWLMHGRYEGRRLRPQ